MTNLDQDRTWHGGRATRASTPSGVIAGDVFGGRYRIESFLARGGMGEVYRAFDLDLGISVALKIVRPEIASDAQALRRLKQEVLMARSISHPNVCRIYDVGRDEEQGVSFLTMEYLAGETLGARIQSQGPMAPEVAMPIVRQIAEALHAAHQAGVVHRDFKSSNVMLMEREGSDRAVIMDFGLAVSWEEPLAHRSPESSGEFEGTPAYMSPEQVAGGRVGPATDLYALGVVLFEMATGQLPFRGSPIETAKARLTTAPPAPSSLAPVDAEWERTILKLLARDPAERYASGRDVVRALEGRDTIVVQTTHSLPAERDAFVGREGELERIVEHLESNRDADVAGRLLTLLGVGGTGKTRLAQRYGWRSLARWPGGTWFCDLSDVHALDGVLSSVAASLGVSLGKDDPVVQLGHAIAGRGRALVILDNAEHVADHASAVLAAWLRRCREASFLVTSRERLRLDGEAVLALKPLDPVTDGVELFALRARASRPGFQLDPSSRAAVVEIVEKLDGLPLAIELAAARLRMLSLEQIRDRLADRFQLLAGGTRGRHATLDATLEWSWQLLLPWEQSAVAQATVFEGGFTLEAAEAVIDLSPFPEAPLVLDAMQSLVDKSWLQTRITREIPRFEMLATVRAFGSKAPRSGREPENAAARGFAARDLEERHARYFAAMGGDDALAALDGSRSVERRAELGLELENLIAACRRATELAIGEVAGPAYLAAGEMLALRGPIGSSLALGRRVLEVLRDPALRSRVARLLAEAEAIAGEPAAATEHVDQSLAAAREAHDRRFEGVVLGSLGNLLREQGQMERARAAFEAALAIHRETGHRRLEGVVLSTLGILLRELGQMEIARRHCEEALPIHREIGDRRSEGATLGALGTLHMEQGRMREAGTCFEQALAIHREVGNRLAEGTLLGNMGIFDREEGRMEAARGHFERALAIHRQAGHRRAEGVTLGNLASLDHDLGRLEDARAQFEEALAIHREVGNRRSEGIVLGNLGNLYSELGRETDARACYEQALVIAREVGNRRFEGNVLANLGDLHQEQGRMAEARLHLEQALAIHRDAGDLRHQGCVLGFLGIHYQKLGDSAQAGRLFDQGIAVLRQVNERQELAKILCRRGENDLQRRDVAAARVACDEAEQIARSLAVEPESDLARLIAGLRSAVQDARP